MNAEDSPEIPGSLELLGTLVGIPTVSRDSNLALIQFIESFLSGHGITAHKVLSEDGQKANLYAVIGPEDVPGVVLSGHTDVVPVDGQPWTSDPFALKVADGRAVGRGTSDMKGFVACALRCAALASQQTLKRPLILAFSHDEEIGCVGVRRLLPALAELPVKPLLCIVGESTWMGVVTAHKGKVMGRIDCTGIAGHSSDPANGVNAIFLAAEMIAAAREIQQRFATPAYCDAEFSVPYSTLHIGTIHGGTILNIIPRYCVIDFEIRNLPMADPELILDALREAAERIAAPYRAQADGVRIEVQVTNRYPALETDATHPAIAFVQDLCGIPGYSKVPYGTEAGLFRNELDLPTVVCGPGSVAQAHKPDEFIDLSQLNACDRFLDRLVERLAGDFTL